LEDWAMTYNGKTVTDNARVDKGTTVAILFNYRTLLWLASPNPMNPMMNLPIFEIALTCR